MVNVQEWLDKNYPKEERSKIIKIFLTEPTLEGELNLEDFTRGYGVGVYISPQVDETKLVFKNKLERVEIIPAVVQRYIDYHYPTKQSREKVTELNINRKSLEGNLDLSDFTNLRKLDFRMNELKFLNLSKCSRLEEIYSYYNLLTNIILPTNSTNLKELGLSDNNFPTTCDLSFLTRAINLERLHLGNSKYNKEKIQQDICNRFTGSLDYLSRMDKLRYLDISNTDINEVDIDKLPRGLKIINYSTKGRPNCKLTEIIPQLEKVRYGFCQKCQQPNTSREWCQPCAEKEWQEDLKHLTGQKLIEKFIKQQWSIKNYSENRTLKWIPYELFSGIEYLAEGGFSKIYKARWKRGVWGKIVVLKSLHNSQNITLDFLREIANTKLVDGVNKKREFTNIVECHGVSQEPITKNYVMVMEYIKDGNIREYLQKNKGLSFRNKLGRLKNVVNGLYDIHKQGLIHRDFHSGNILNSSDENYSYNFITDLGLSQPVNHQKETGKIFGVMPYIAPEVLRSQPYTKASDIYSSGIIMYEWFANSYPYPKIDDMNLALHVCQGLRPEIDKVPIPQLLKDLIKKCWDADPKNRLSAKELKKIIDNWEDEVWDKDKVKTQFYQQYQEIKKEYNLFSQNTPYQIHPTAITISKMIDTKEITKRLNDLGLSEKINVQKSERVFLKDSEEIVPIEIQEQFTDWTNINSSFAKELINQWKENNFIYSQVKEWINIGLQPTDYNFCVWLRDTKQLTPEQVLNHGDLEKLNQEFFIYWQEQRQLQSHQEIPPQGDL